VFRRSALSLSSVSKSKPSKQPAECLWGLNM
jgi:hypothetical protein